MSRSDYEADGNMTWIEAACTLTMFPATMAAQAIDYSLDAWQRSVLFFDILRQRGNTHFAHNARHAPNVLHYQYELVMKVSSLSAR